MVFTILGNILTFLGNIITFFKHLFIILFIGDIFAIMAAVIDFFLVLAVMGGRDAEKAVKTWPSVTGIVLSSRAVRRGREGFNDHTSGLFPEITYSYEVAGKSYTSQNIWPGGGKGYGGPGRPGILARFPENSQTTVYYDPNDPGSAVLERNNPNIKIVLVIVVVVTVFLCIVMPLNVIPGFIR